VITSVKIEGFRGVREGGVEGLAPISILVGPNNTGKSTVLEAIAVLGLGTDAVAVIDLLLRRGGPPLDALQRVVARDAKQANIFADGLSTTLVQRQPLDAASAARLQAKGLEMPMSELLISRRHASSSADAVGGLDFKRTRVLVWGPSDRAFDAGFVDIEAVRASGALEDAYTRIDGAGQLAKVVKSLRRSMPRLSDLRILKVGSDFLLHMFFESEPPVPAYLAGDGFKRLLDLTAAAVGTPKSIVLLEEPESFQHPRYLQELATLLHLAAREGTQIIISTHSIELIDLLLLAPEADGLTYPAVHRMTLHEGKLQATTLDRALAASVREDLVQDLRA
jgi:energy-coupling factor transporter ATP-binding protein EcfA2